MRNAQPLSPAAGRQPLEQVQQVQKVLEEPAAGTPLTDDANRESPRMRWPVFRCSTGRSGRCLPGATARLDNRVSRATHLEDGDAGQASSGQSAGCPPAATWEQAAAGPAEAAADTSGWAGHQTSSPCKQVAGLMGIIFQMSVPNILGRIRHHGDNPVSYAHSSACGWSHGRPSHGPESHPRTLQPGSGLLRCPQAAQGLRAINDRWP